MKEESSYNEKSTFFYYNQENPACQISKIFGEMYLGHRKIPMMEPFSITLHKK